MERIISENKRFVAVLSYDKYPLNPREEYDYLGHIVYRKSSRYILGDEGVDPDTWKLPDNCVSLAVYAHIHSDVHLSTVPCANGWDQGHCGYIYADRDEVARRCEKRLDDETIKRILQAEIEEYSSYLSGDVYCRTIYRVPEGCDPETVDLNKCEELEACGGYYGYSWAMDMATADLATYEKEPIQLSLL